MTRCLLHLRYLRADRQYYSNRLHRKLTVEPVKMVSGQADSNNGLEMLVIQRQQRTRLLSLHTYFANDKSRSDVSFKTCSLI